MFCKRQEDQDIRKEEKEESDGRGEEDEHLFKLCYTHERIPMMNVVIIYDKYALIKNF